MIACRTDALAGITFHTHTDSHTMPSATLSRDRTGRVDATLARDPTGRVTATLTLHEPGER